MTHAQQPRTGFTIVELLIVIVVIGILAAITIVAFNGIQGRARTAVIKSDISQAVRKLEAVKVTNASGMYPATQADAGLQPSAGNTLNYYYDSLTNRYCVEVYNGTTTFFSVDMGQTVSSGRCTGSGLIAWWTMNNTTNDQIAAGNNGAAVGLVGTTGQNGTPNSAYLYNATDSIMTVPTSASLHPESMSMALWVRPTSWSTTAASVFIAKRTGNSGYFFHYLTAPQTVHIDIGGSANRWNTFYTPPLNEWTHMVMTINPTSGRSFYVNGQLQASTTTALNPIIPAASELSIGSENGYGYRMSGSIDDVRMYSRVLSAGEVQSLFAQGAQ